MCVYSFEEISDRVRPVAEKYGLFRLGGVYDDFCTALEMEVDMVTLRSLERQRGTSLGGRFVQEVEPDRRKII